MTTQKLNKEIAKILIENSRDKFSINFVKTRGYKEEENKIQKVIISLDDYNSGENILVMIKEILDIFQYKYNLCIEQRFVEF